TLLANHGRFHPRRRLGDLNVENSHDEPLRARRCLVRHRIFSRITQIESFPARVRFEGHDLASRLDRDLPARLAKLRHANVASFGPVSPNLPVCCHLVLQAKSCSDRIKNRKDRQRSLEKLLPIFPNAAFSAAMAFGPTPCSSESSSSLHFDNCETERMPACSS